MLVQNLVHQTNQSNLAENSHHTEEVCQSKQDEKHNEVLAMSVAEHGDSPTNMVPQDLDTSASSSVEFASLCGSFDTLYSAGESWPIANNTD